MRHAIQKWIENLVAVRRNAKAQAESSPPSDSSTSSNSSTAGSSNSDSSGSKGRKEVGGKDGLGSAEVVVADGTHTRALSDSFVVSIPKEYTNPKHMREAHPGLERNHLSSARV